MFETYPGFFEEWAKDLSPDFAFTDLVIIGGDGLWILLVNAIHSHKHDETRE
jgi:hypothetical protein